MSELLRGKILQKADGSRHNASVVLQNKLVGLYFSGHWCPPSRDFTPRLKQFYDQTWNFEVVFISSDRSEQEFYWFMKESHGDWYAIPFNDQQLRNYYSQMYSVNSIPTLIIINVKGGFYTKNGVADVMQFTPANALNRWVGGNITLYQHQNVSTTNQGIFSGVTLHKADGSRHDGGVVLKNKVVGLYFSAHWCSPSRDFTPLLKKFYDQIPNFEIVFVSNDRTEQEFHTYMKESHGNWYAIPFSDLQYRNKLMQENSVTSIPFLTVVDEQGNGTYTRDGVRDVQQYSAADAWFRWTGKRLVQQQQQTVITTKKEETSPSKQPTPLVEKSSTQPSKSCDTKQTVAAKSSASSEKSKSIGGKSVQSQQQSVKTTKKEVYAQEQPELQVNNNSTSSSKSSEMHQTVVKKSVTSKENNEPAIRTVTVTTTKTEVTPSGEVRTSTTTSQDEETFEHGQESEATFQTTTQNSAGLRGFSARTVETNQDLMNLMAVRESFWGPAPPAYSELDTSRTSSSYSYTSSSSSGGNTSYSFSSSSGNVGGGQAFSSQTVRGTFPEFLGFESMSLQEEKK